MQSEAPILSLFSGIGGFELGFRKAGFDGPVDAYENWSPAREVLSKRFPGMALHEDVQDMPAHMHDAHIVVAGFPCTDLSQAGRQAGIEGSASGLIRGVLTALPEAKPEWVLLENVPNMLRLKQGNAIRVITEALTAAGYLWAYRTLDAQYFGLAQRRKRVFLLASLHHDPSRVLFRDMAQARPVHRQQPRKHAKANGFYWTEGNRGMGWGPGVVPTIKGSTTQGIPSPPAVWLPMAPSDERFRTPSIEALEVLQGFTAGWTQAAPMRDRWKLVGNAVAVPVVRWIAEGLRRYDDLPTVDLAGETAAGQGWAWAGASDRVAKHFGRLPDSLATGTVARRESLEHLLQSRGSHALSPKAARGFTGRLQKSRLRHDPDFMKDLVAYSGI